MLIQARKLLVLTLLGLFCSPAWAGFLFFGSSEKGVSYEKDVTPILEKYCYSCHGNGKSKGDLALDDYKTTADVLKDKKVWELVLHHVHTHEMPPENKPQPSQGERDKITAWIEKELFKYDPKHPDPGRVTIRRLNRAEYNNTIHDLVGVDFQPAADFPADDSGYGFDNIGDVLSLPPMLMEKYLSAADKILNQAVVTEPITSKTWTFPANRAEVSFNSKGDRGDGWVQLISLEEDEVSVELPVFAGDYSIRVRAFAKEDGGVAPYVDNEDSQKRGGLTEYQKGVSDGPMSLSLMVGDVVAREFEVTTNRTQDARLYETRIGVPRGRQKFRLVARRVRDGLSETFIKGDRIGKEQPGVIFVKELEIEGPLPGANNRFDIADLEKSAGAATDKSGSIVFKQPGEVSAKVNSKSGGVCILRAQAFASQAGTEPARMEFRLNGRKAQEFEVLAPATHLPQPGQPLAGSAIVKPVPYIYECRARLQPGENRFSAAFINGFSDPKNPDPNLRERELMIQNLEVVCLDEDAPLPPLTKPLEQIFTEEPTPATKAKAARETIGRFVTRAWRRPITTAEADRFMTLFDLADQQGESFKGSVKLAMKAALVSPHFLFRGELQPHPDDPASVQKINEYDLASRLSYFIWSSMPDDELFQQAAKGTLRLNLDSEVKRMLASPKAHALVDNFEGQWLQTRALKSFAPDKELFPDFDEHLRSSMQEETDRFFEYVMDQDRSVMDFLNGDYTFVNERLAKLYGIPGINGDDFRMVSLKNLPRRGVLTQGSVLLLTSNPTRTSPVKRGKWVLENLLGSPPPPPPPDVPVLKNDGKPLTGTLRHQMEEHRENPVCASCHARMDPIGFGLENFDAIGAWREKEGEFKVDPSGQLITGEKFSGAVDLTNILARKKRDEFARCIAEKMLTYALGRGLEYYDRSATDEIVKGMSKDKYKFSSLIEEVVKSVPFQMRRGEGEKLASN